MELTSNRKGYIAECKAVARASELGYVVSRPIVNCRYDLIFDDGNRLLRVQVKSTGRRVSHCTGAFCVNLVYETRHQRTVNTYSDDEIDALVVYIPSIDKLCWIPPRDFVGKKALSMRVENTKNGQSKKVRYASDYFW